MNLLIFNGHGNFQDWGLDLFWRVSSMPQLGAGHWTAGRTSPTAKQEALSATLEAMVRLGYPRVGEALLRGRIMALTKDSSDRVRAIQAMTLLGLPSMGLR